MIYLRKILDMFFLSMVPSLISFLLMSQFLNYITWFVCCIISTLIFFIGNALLIRRFVRDIKRTSTYYMVWLVTFVLYTAGGALCLWKKWMYPFTWIYFHTRILSVLTIPTDELPVWISFTVSMLVFLALILIARPIFLARYNKEVERNEEMERNARRMAKEERMRHEREKAGIASTGQNYALSDFEESEGEHRHHRHRIYDDDNAVYTMRQYRRIERLQNLEATGTRKRIGVQKAAGDKMTKRLSEFFLNMGSYEFYQVLADRVDQGCDPWPIIQTYLKRRLSLGLKAGKRK